LKRKLYSYRIPQWRKNVLTLSCIMDFVFRPIRRFRSGFQKSRHHILSSCLSTFSFFFFLFSFFFFLFLSRFIKVPYPGFVLLDRSRFIKKQWLHELCFFLVSVLHIKIIYDRNWNCNSNSKVRILNIKKKTY